MDEIDYLHLKPGQTPPEMRGGPFKAVVVIDEPVASEWRHLVSAWLVRCGCLYMMAWGPDCSLWDDSVDHANLAEFDYADIPDDKFVMTTWHDKEPLSEALWYAAHNAHHPDVVLRRTLIVDIAQGDRRKQLLAEYDQAARAEI
jgi:hypothetical protein